MVVYFVEEGGADIWATAYTHYDALRTIYGSDYHDAQARRRSTVWRPAVLPLHMAACEGNKYLLEYFLTECKMPVNTRTPDLQLTALHCLAASERNETDLLPIVTWLVEEKGADVMCRDKKGYTAARLAAIRKKTSVHRYLQAQEAEKKEQEERREKAAAAAAAVQMQQTEEALAALLLELEEEEQAAAAAGSKKKEGKTSSGKKKKKR
jgi:hypothetical protein